MKTVFSNSDGVLHSFAQKSQANGKSSSIYFETSYNWGRDYGDKIYSYGRHYLLGQFVEHGGTEFLFINDSGYGNTTAKHISCLNYATRQHAQILKTRFDVMCLVVSIESNFQSLKSARKKELYTGEILRAGSLLKIPASIPCGDYIYQPNNGAEVIIGRKNIFKQYPEVQERVKKALRLFAKIEQGGVDFAAIAKAEKEKKAKAAAAAQKHLTAMLKKWEKGEIDNFSNKTEEDYLRLSGENVETTQGVKIPVTEAAKLYRAILAGQDVKGFEVGRYRVTSLNGVLTVGCHRINTGSMHKVGKQITATV